MGLVKKKIDFYQNVTLFLFIYFYYYLFMYFLKQL